MIKTLIARYSDGALPHAALLLTGPEEALEQAQALIDRLSLNPADYLIVPTGESIKVAQARDIRQFCQQTRFTSPIKLVVIPQADLLTPQAANALLKTLEEPPEHTHLILASSRPEQLLPTIRSRCQTLAIDSFTVDIPRQISPEAGANELPDLPTGDLISQLERTKQLAAGEIGLTTLCDHWLAQAALAGQTKAISVLLKHLAAAHTSVNRRLLLDNIVLDLYNAD